MSLAETMCRFIVVLVVLMAVPRWLQKYVYIGVGLPGAMSFVVIPMLGTGAPMSQPRWMGPQDISFQSPLVFQLVWLGSKDEA